MSTDRPHREHTPLPWRHNKYGSIGAGETGAHPIVASVEPFYGSDRKHGDHSANLDLIVASVNSHYGLIEALEKAKVLIGARNDTLHEAQRQSNINDAWHVIDAALKVARGEK